MSRIAPFAAVPCPRCGVIAEPYDWSDVDIGVGVQTWDHSWLCSTHGEFGRAQEDGEIMFREDGAASGGFDDKELT